MSSYDREDRYDGRKDNRGSKDILVGWGIDMRLVSKLGMFEFIREAGDGKKLVKFAIGKESIDSQIDREKVLDHIDRWLWNRGGKAEYAASVINSESGQDFRALGKNMAGLVFRESATRCREAAEDAASRYFPIDSPRVVPVYVSNDSMYEGEAEDAQDKAPVKSGGENGHQEQSFSIGGRDARLDINVHVDQSCLSHSGLSYHTGNYSPSYSGRSYLGRSMGISTGGSVGCSKVFSSDNSTCINCGVAWCAKNVAWHAKKSAGIRSEDLSH